MAGPRPADPRLDLDRIRKQQSQRRRRRTRLRIVITSDPDRPVRTFTLPRALPKVVVISGLVLLGATLVLACGSWRLSGTLGRLERRMRAMVQAADSVALAAPDGAGAATGARGSAAAAPARGPAGAMGRFVVESVNTGETMEVALNLATGEVDADSYRRLRHLMRCLRTGAETPVDPRLIDLLYRIAQRTRQKIMLVSGFRAPMFSIATLSYHTRGMAADIRIPGMTPLMVRDLAESMGVGGVGYYPVSGFVHVDVREERSRWIDYGRNRNDGDGVEHDPTRGEAAETDEPAAAPPAAAAAGPG
jgi:uncharacterized protein YcbK (DUF882 family)